MSEHSFEWVVLSQARTHKHCNFDRNAFARRALQAQLGLYFAWLLTFTVFTWLFQVI